MADVLDLPVRDLFREALSEKKMDSLQTRSSGALGRGSSSLARQDAYEAHALSAEDLDAASAILGAAFALLVRESVPLMQKLGIPLLAAALREERPGAAVAGLLADVATESLIFEANGDPLAQALAASAQRRRELLAEAGGGLSTAAVASALGTSRQAVDKRRRGGTLLAVQMPAGEWVFPAAQFGPDGRPLDGLAEALRAFRIEDPWMRLAELLAPDADFENRSALQVLREEGRKALPAILRALASVGEHGA